MSRITINTNINSLNTQRRLGQHTSELRSSFERLSSGLRIDRASDDAAGLSVSSLLNADRRVLNQGVRNINDGISYLNVAESAITELSGIVTRVQELAEQSANGTIGDTQRKALQDEVTSLQSEYNRIIATTSFNGNQLLTGENTRTILQGGYGLSGQLATQIGDASLGILNDPTRAGETVRASTTSTGVQANGGSINASISADGRYLVYESQASNLVVGDTNGVRDIFRKDLLTGEIVRVSASNSGVQANAFSSGASISTDGRYVAFQSNSESLVA